MSLILRQAKGSKLTIQEMDNNLSYLENIALATDEVNYNQTVATPVTVVDGGTGSVATVTITTSGNPVQFIATGEANPISGTGSWCRLQLYRDGSPIGNKIQCESSNINENIPFALNFIDIVSAGTYSYSLEAVTVSGSDFEFGEEDGVVLTVVELSTSGGAGFSQTANSVSDSTYSNAKGGCYNQINCSENSTIIGGYNNYIGSSYGYYGSCPSESNSIIGGECNEICDTNFSSIIGGRCNCICTELGNYNTIVGGFYNTICEYTDHSAIIGGCYNKIASYNADADYSAIIGGQYNYNCASQGGVILGGICNKLYNYSYCSAILGGYENRMSCSYNSSMIGGFCNKIYYEYYSDVRNSATLGGYRNCLCGGCNSLLLGGEFNFVECSSNSTIINSSVDDYWAISSGYRNEITKSKQSSIISHYSSYGSYIYNSCNSSIFAGSSYYGTILNSCNAIILNGQGCNYIYQTYNSSIIGGYSHCIHTNSKYSAILGGNENRLHSYSYSSVIVGGASHELCTNSRCSVIIGGYDNRLYCNSNNASIIGGRFNCVRNTSYQSSIIGGDCNSIHSSSNTAIIAGCGISLVGCSNTVFVPGIIAGTVSDNSLVKWKLGKTQSAVSAIVDTQQYVEVDINGAIVKLAIIV